MKLSLVHSVVVWLLVSLLFFKGDNTVYAKESQTANQDSPCLLTLGVSNWPPFQSIAKNGVPSGLQITLIQQIATEVGCHLNYRQMTFPEGLFALRQGSVDFLLNATKSAEREEFAHFSVPYRAEFLLLYSTEKYLEKCHQVSLTELIKDGFVLGLQPGLVYGPELTKIQQDKELKHKLHYVENNVQHLQLVLEEGLDGIVDDPVVVSYRSTMETTGKALSSCPIVVSSSPVSLIFSKRTVSAELVTRFNQAIGRIKETPEYQEQWSW